MAKLLGMKGPPPSRGAQDDAVLQETFGGVVFPASKTPYPI